jgi:hypothetical protein
MVVVCSSTVDLLVELSAELPTQRELIRKDWYVVALYSSTVELPA